MRGPGDVKQPEDAYLSGTVTADISYTYDIGEFWKVGNADISLAMRNIFQTRPEPPSYEPGAILVDPRGRIAFARMVVGF